MIKYKVAEKKLTSDSAKSEKAKKGNDKIMDNIWKLMKYTQGENNQNKSMQFCMPVFIHIETLWRQDERHKLNDDNASNYTNNSRKSLINDQTISRFIDIQSKLETFENNGVFEDLR